MFTGLIQSIGKIHQRGAGLLIEGCEPFSPLIIGESIAVDGVCLTVVDLVPNGFLADVSEETLNRTTLRKKAESGEFVNLEPALRFSDRLGGHLVSGHVDGLGEVISIKELTKSWLVDVQWQNSNFARYICEKGSISLNGISLTVAGFTDKGSRFWIAIIPHTWTNTALKHLKTGSLVNLEVDLMAKYAERLLAEKISPQFPSDKDEENQLSMSWLASQGWG